MIMIIIYQKQPAGITRIRSRFSRYNVWVDIRALNEPSQKLHNVSFTITPLLGPSRGWKCLLLSDFTFKILVGAFNQEKALLRDCKTLRNLREPWFEALVDIQLWLIDQELWLDDEMQHTSHGRSSAYTGLTVSVQPNVVISVYQRMTADLLLVATFLR